MKNKELNKTLSKYIFLIACFVTLIINMQCTEAEEEYTDLYSHFIFENNIHLNSTLAAAMTPYAHTFCIVRRINKLVNNEFIEYYEFKDNYGNPSSLSKITAKQKAGRYVLGRNNALIIGFSAMSDIPELYVYDGACPNCPLNIISSKASSLLEITKNSTAICHICKRQYNLNIKGIIVSGQRGKKLIRYRATTTAPYGVLIVR